MPTLKTQEALTSHRLSHSISNQPEDSRLRLIGYIYLINTINLNSIV